jgi:hypothetical protein
MKQKICSWLALLFAINFHLIAQSDNYSHFNYISPVPNSQYVSPLSNIIIRTTDDIDRLVINSKDLIEVTGAISGLHKGKLILLEDNRTFIYNPESPFTEGEAVTVFFKGNKIAAGENKIADLNFNFTISDSWAENIGYLNSVILLDEFKLSNSFEREKAFKANHNIVSSNTINIFPQDFPEYFISISNNPSDGYVFSAPFPWPDYVPAYLIIMDNYGMPVFYRRSNERCLDFKLNKNGLLTYFNHTKRKFYALDSSYTPVDSFACGNGYITDSHDLQVLPNGHSLLMAYDPQTVRMDEIVRGGNEAARVIGLIIQELDENKNVVFQWRSWDHFKITDASDDIDLTGYTVDYVHGNSVELDIDGNLIISSRHMDEITKISRTTGEIIWRLGGKNNQFQFVNDPRGFSHQHDVRRTSENNLTLFNNGNLLSPQYSSALEYQLNETDKIATLVWEYSEIPVYGRAMGSSQRLDNGNTVISWGNIFNPAITEIQNDGTKIFELYFNSSFSYRAFRFPWRTNLLTADNYIVDFEYVPINASNTREIVVTNNSNEQLELTSYHRRSSVFSVVENFPITLQPYEDKIISIQLFPDSIGIFSDNIHLQMKKENELIAQVINVIGYSDPSVDVEDNNTSPQEYKLLQNFPNPFNPGTSIEFSVPVNSSITLTIYNLLGQVVTTLVNEEISAGSYSVVWNGEDKNGLKVSSGIYLYTIQATGTNGKEFQQIRKMVLLR